MTSPELDPSDNPPAASEAIIAEEQPAGPKEASGGAESRVARPDRPEVADAFYLLVEALNDKIRSTLNAAMANKLAWLPREATADEMAAAIRPLQKKMRN